MNKKIQSMADMKCYTSEEFGKHMDEILDRVAKENIGVIIDHKGRSYVVCPFEWIAPNYKLINRMILRSVQETLFRPQEYVKPVVKEILGLLDWLTPKTIQSIIREITDADNLEIKLTERDTWRNTADVLGARYDEITQNDEETEQGFVREIPVFDSGECLDGNAFN